MKRKRNWLFSNFTFDKWKNLLLIAVFSINLCQFVFSVVIGGFPQGYGGDYLAFWSAGKIADEKGYSEIYDINNLRIVQTQELKVLGILKKPYDHPIIPIPVPIFSFFVLPFQLLSRVNLVSGYWVWTIFNLAVLVGYLSFFIQKTSPGESTLFSNKKILFLMLLSYPVLRNLIEGQINMFMLVCIGEFIRNTVGKKPVISGLWLGGLLLKPQMLILIIPYILIMRYWKVLKGLIVTSGIVLSSSLFLSGFAGMKGLIGLWVGWGTGSTTNAPKYMINWRMIGINFDTLLKSSLGLVIAGIGVILTILTVIYLIKHNPLYGSSQWIMTILGIFSATLAVTWHAHSHMALVLIPFLVFSSFYKLLPEKTIFLWVIVTPLVWLVMWIVILFVLLSTKIDILEYQGIVIALSGFILNLAILNSTVRLPYMRSV